jgi:hypothetical protein
VGEAAGKPLEAKLAALVRMLGTEHEGEAVATWRALKRLLASHQASFNDLGNAVERLATGLEEAEMQRIFDAGRAEGARESARAARAAREENEATFGKRADGSTDWEAIALHVQREKARLEPKHHQFADDMASRMTWGGREPTPKQGMYLLSLFRQLGGKIA